jgi:translation initiation factor 4E
MRSIFTATTPFLPSPSLPLTRQCRHWQTTKLPVTVPSSTNNTPQHTATHIHTDAHRTPEGKHKLYTPFAFWVLDKSTIASKGYDKSINKLGTFDTVEDFWNHYSHLTRFKDLQVHTDCHMFRDGITPMWEDEANNEGGKWIIRVRKGLADRIWEDVLLAIIGGEFGTGDELCGVVISLKPAETIISFWNKTAHDTVRQNFIKNAIKKTLGQKKDSVLEYKAHNQSLQNTRSYNNKREKERQRMERERKATAEEAQRLARERSERDAKEKLAKVEAASATDEISKMLGLVISDTPSQPQSKMMAFMDEGDE